LSHTIFPLISQIYLLKNLRSSAGFQICVHLRAIFFFPLISLIFSKRLCLIVAVYFPADLADLFAGKSAFICGFLNLRLSAGNFSFQK